MRHRTLLAAGAIVLLTAAPAGAGVQPVQPISPGDPYASCTAGASDGGVNYPGAEVEPWVSADPRHPGRVIGVYQQDRWSDGGARGLAASYSRDGRHFTKTTLPFSVCAPGGLNYERASDPWVSFGPDGVAYASGLNFDASTPRNGVGAATSYDGGKTWTYVTQLIDDTDPAFVDDKNSVTADPLHPGVAYQVWDRIDQVSTGPGAVYNGPSYIAITRDHGRHWTPAHQFVDTSVIPNSQTIGNVIVADPRTGRLYDFFEWQTYRDVTASEVADLHFAVVSSADQGRTWSKPVTIAADTSVAEVDPNAPDDPAKALRAGFNLISPAVDPRTGELYATFEGSTFTGGAYDDIELVHSTDGGRTWSAPARVNRVPSAPAFTPSIAVDSRGTVAITYYDLRYLEPGDTSTLPTAMFLVTGASERRISRVFDWLQAPYAGWGHFLGDYESLTLDGGRLRPILVEANSGMPANSTDVFTGLFGIATRVNGTAAATPRAAAVHPVGHRFRH
jgi:hypothetical protein